MMNSSRLLIFFLISLKTSQLDDDNYRKFLGFVNRQFDEREFINIGNFESDIYNKDFSKLWTIKKLNVDSSYRNPIRPEPLGYIGNNFQRLLIHFSEVRKDRLNSKKYFVSGKSKVKNNICAFTGYLQIELTREFALQYIKGVDYTIDPRTIREGVIVGTYQLKEDPSQKHSGIFKGKFITSFYLDSKGRIDYNVSEIFSDNYINNQFEGTWIPYNSDSTKVCNWGDYRIPKSTDLDFGAGEFSVNPKFIHNGWENYQKAFEYSSDSIGISKARQKELEEWWK